MPLPAAAPGAGEGSGDRDATVAAAAAPASHGKTRKPRKPRKKSVTVKSKAWKHFSKLDVDGEKKAKCMHCNDIFAADPNINGTSSLLTHIRVCPKNKENIDKRQKLILFKGGAGGELTSWHFDQQTCRDALAKMLVTDELPFNFVKGAGFKLFMEIACPLFKIPSRHTCLRDVFELYESEKAKLHAYFTCCKPRVSLTTDTWTSNQQRSYMTLTAHYIDVDWVLHKQILNFCPIQSHKGEDIGKYIEACLNSWGIDKIMTVTVDNASANDKAIEYLTRRMNLLSTNVLGGRFLHMRCIAHIINLVVSDGISMLGTSVERVRFAVRFIKLSPLRLSRFKDAVERAGIESKKLLCLDVSTRWNSTYLMLDAACRLQKAFERYDVIDPVLGIEMENKLRKDGTPLGRLTFSDWSELHSFMSFLKKFYNITVRVSGSSYATSNSILDEISDVFYFLNNGLSSENRDMRSMAGKMALKFDKYFADMEMLNMYTFIAPVLDPRKKLDCVNYMIEHIYPPNIVDQLKPCVKQALTDLFAEYVKLYGVVVESSSQEASSSTVGDLDNNVFFNQYKKQRVEEGGSVKSELERYLKDPEEESSSSFDVLQWWRMNGHRYPVIAHMARDILAIPISTVSSESAFSTGGRIITDFRSSLSPTVVQCLVCTQDWLKVPLNMDDLEEELHKLQIVEEEIGETASPIGAPSLI